MDSSAPRPRNDGTESTDGQQRPSGQRVTHTISSSLIAVERAIDVKTDKILDQEEHVQPETFDHEQVHLHTRRRNYTRKAQYILVAIGLASYAAFKVLELVQAYDSAKLVMQNLETALPFGEGSVQSPVLAFCMISTHVADWHVKSVRDHLDEQMSASHHEGAQVLESSWGVEHYHDLLDSTSAFTRPLNRTAGHECSIFHHTTTTTTPWPSGGRRLQRGGSVAPTPDLECTTITIGNQTRTMCTASSPSPSLGDPCQTSTVGNKTVVICFEELSVNSTTGTTSTTLQDPPLGELSPWHDDDFIGEVVRGTLSLSTNDPEAFAADPEATAGVIKGLAAVLGFEESLIEAVLSVVDAGRRLSGARALTDSKIVQVDYTVTLPQGQTADALASIIRGTSKGAWTVAIQEGVAATTASPNYLVTVNAVTVDTSADAEPTAQRTGAPCWQCIMIPSQRLDSVAQDLEVHLKVKSTSPSARSVFGFWNALDSAIAADTEALHRYLFHGSRHIFQYMWKPCTAAVATVRHHQREHVVDGVSRSFSLDITSFHDDTCEAWGQWQPAKFKVRQDPSGLLYRQVYDYQVKWADALAAIGGMGSTINGLCTLAAMIIIGRFASTAQDNFFLRKLRQHLHYISMEQIQRETTHVACGDTPQDVDAGQVESRTPTCGGSGEAGPSPPVVSQEQADASTSCPLPDLRLEMRQFMAAQEEERRRLQECVVSLQATQEEEREERRRLQDCVETLQAEVDSLRHEVGTEL